MSRPTVAALSSGILVPAEADTSFTTVVLYTEHASSEVPATVQHMVSRLRNFTNVLPLSIHNQLDFNACLEQADVVVNMLSGPTQLPVMYIGIDPSQAVIPRAIKTTHMFNFVTPQDSASAGNPSAVEERADVLCRKIQTCLLEKAQQSAQDVQLLCFIS